MEPRLRFYNEDKLNVIYPHTPSSLSFLSVIRDNMTIYIPDNLCPLNVFILVPLIYGNMDCRKKSFLWFVLQYNTTHTTGISMSVSIKM